MRLGALATAALVAASTPTSASADVRLAVLVGNDVGRPSDEPLRFAEGDAARMRDVLVDLGRVEADRAFLLQGRDRAALQSVLSEVRGRAQELRAAGSDVTLIFYYSGHGDAEALYLGRTRVSRAELRRWVEALPVELRVLFLDTCSTAASRTRGVRRGSAFDVYVDEEAATRGTVIISSTRDGEPAQESDRLGGAVFTHYLVSGLRGAADRDGDGRVSVSEAYAHAYRRTVLRSASGAPAVQHPAFDFDVSGSGDVILSEPARSSAALLLPAGRDARYLVYGLPSGAVLAETGSSASRPVRLAVPPGRLLVQRRVGATFGVTEVLLRRGSTLQVEPSDFRAVPYEEVALRGGRFDLHPTALGIGGSVGFVGLGGALVLVAGPEVHISHRVGRLVVGARLATDLGAFETSWARVLALDLRADALLGAWIQAGPVTLHLRGGPRVTALRQAIDHLDAGRLEATGQESRWVRWVPGVGGVLSLGLALPLGRGVSLSFWASGSVLAMPLATDTGPVWGPVPGARASMALHFAP